MENTEIKSKIKWGSEELIKAGDRHFIYLYKVTNLIDGKIYIGVRSYKGDDVNRDTYLGNGMKLKKNGEIEYSNYSHSTHLARSFDKHGITNFRKDILFYYDSLGRALEDESLIVDKFFIKQPYSLNMIVGGGMPPTGKGELNNNYKNYWSSEQKLALAKTIRDGGHAKGDKNVKAKPSILFDLINDKQYDLEYMSQITDLFPNIKDFTPLTYISSFQYYLLPNQFKDLTVDQAIEKFGKDNTKRTYHLIKTYKQVGNDVQKLRELTGMLPMHITLFLKKIKDESINN